MTDLTTGLTSALVSPGSIKHEKRGKAYYLDEKTDTQPNQNNTMLFLSMKELFPDEADTINTIAKEENKYLMAAMKILAKPDDGTDPGLGRLKDKFGKDVKGSQSLAELLKTKAIDLEFDEQINKHAASLVPQLNGSQSAFRSNSAIS